jgi:hypothetical protein
MIRFLYILIFSALSCVNAEELLIAKAGSDIDASVTEYYLEVVDGRINSLRFVAKEGGKVSSDDTYTVEDLMEGGIVIVHRENRDIIRLEVKKFSPETGGVIIHDFMFNGLTGSRSSLQTHLKKIGEAFVYSDANGKRINRLKNIGNRKMGRVVGISWIKTSYEE